MLRSRMSSVFSLGCVAVSALCLEAQEKELYNETALYSCENSWDIQFKADYLYWTWQQSMMQVGTLISPTSSGEDVFLNGQEDVVFQTPGYTSGFQVGLGCNFHGMDDWNLMAEYTWYQNSNHLRTISGSDQYFAVSPTLIKQIQGTNLGVLLSGDLSTETDLHFDGLDVLLQRGFYISKNIRAIFSTGLKALWIHETLSSSGDDLSYIEAGEETPVSVAGSFQTAAEIRSWGLGPKFGIQAEWLLGLGIKIIGNVATSILYTSYTTIQNSITGQVSNRESADLVLQQRHPYTILNPVGEASLGLGWGSYLCNNTIYLRLSASYDWNVYWNYALLDVLLPSRGSPGNMTLRGLNAQIGVDF